MNLKIILVLWQLFIAQVLSFEIVRDSDRLLLRSSSCEEVYEISNSLKQWTKKTESQKVCDAKSGIQRNEGFCEIDIRSCVPDHVFKYHGLKPELDGPNCWNLALVLKGILPALRFSTPEEMTFYMRPPLCRPLSDDEQPKPGDIGAIRADEFEIHGFVYISDKIAYSKNGMARTSPFLLQPLELIEERYYKGGRSNDPECENSKSKPTCPSLATYFRCISMREYLKSHKNISKEILETLNQFDSFENCIEEQAVRNIALTEEATNNIVEVAQALATYLDQQINSNNPQTELNEQELFMLGALQMRLGSIVEQLAWGGADSGLSGHERLKPLEEAISKSISNLVEREHK